MPEHTRPQSILPPDLLEVISKLPPKLRRKRISEELFQNLGIEVSPRTLERWPLSVQIVCGKAIAPTVQAFEIAYSKLLEAPVILSGERKPASQIAAPVEQDKRPQQAPAGNLSPLEDHIVGGPRNRRSGAR
jgi:hypothetical protein